MDYEKVVIMSARQGMLNEFFANVLGELRQKSVQITSEDDLRDINSFIHKHLTDDDLLVSNDRYLEELRDFTVFNADAKPILSVSADGQRINQKDSEYYLNDEEALSKLITLANLIMRSNDLYNIVYSS